MLRAVFGFSGSCKGSTKVLCGVTWCFLKYGGALSFIYNGTLAYIPYVLYDLHKIPRTKCQPRNRLKSTLLRGLLSVLGLCKGATTGST